MPASERPPKIDERLTETPEAWERLPFRLTATQKAEMYLAGWQGRHCSRLCLSAEAQMCREECELPSVGRVQRNAGVSHGTAGVARKRVESSEQSPCLESGERRGP